jgi:hypothetical protein
VQVRRPLRRRVGFGNRFTRRFDGESPHNNIRHTFAASIAEVIAPFGLQAIDAVKPEKELAS